MAWLGSGSSGGFFARMKVMCGNRVHGLCMERLDGHRHSMEHAAEQADADEETHVSHELILSLLFYVPIHKQRANEVQVTIEGQSPQKIYRCLNLSRNSHPVSGYWDL